MTYITEHNTKQEWEGDDGKHSRVSFLVGRDTVSVNNFLECPLNFVDSKERWRFSVMFWD